MNGERAQRRCSLLRAGRSSGQSGCDAIQCSDLAAPAPCSRAPRSSQGGRPQRLAHTPPHTRTHACWPPFARRAKALTACRRHQESSAKQCAFGGTTQCSSQGVSETTHHSGREEAGEQAVAPPFRAARHAHNKRQLALKVRNVGDDGGSARVRFDQPVLQWHVCVPYGLAKTGHVPARTALVSARPPPGATRRVPKLTAARHCLGCCPSCWLPVRLPPLRATPAPCRR